MASVTLVTFMTSFDGRRHPLDAVDDPCDPGPTMGLICECRPRWPTPHRAADAGSAPWMARPAGAEGEGAHTALKSLTAPGMGPGVKGGRVDYAQGGVSKVTAQNGSAEDHACVGPRGQEMGYSQPQRGRRAGRTWSGDPSPIHGYRVPLCRLRPEGTPCGQGQRKHPRCSSHAGGPCFVTSFLNSTSEKLSVF